MNTEPKRPVLDPLAPDCSFHGGDESLDSIRYRPNPARLGTATSDIVTELRRGTWWSSGGVPEDPAGVDVLLFRAASEIERLRAELARFDPVLTLAEGDELTLGDGFVAYRGPGTLYELLEESP